MRQIPLFAVEPVYLRRSRQAENAGNGEDQKCDVCKEFFHLRIPLFEVHKNICAELAGHIQERS